MHPIDNFTIRFFFLQRVFHFTMRVQCIYNIYTLSHCKIYSVATVNLQWLYNDAAPPTVNPL